MTAKLRKRLDALESRLSRSAVGEPCDTCGAPQRTKRVGFWLGLETDLGECKACGRHLLLKEGGRPLEAEHLTRIVRGTPPPGWREPEI
jgi:ssDNA-binding Zn-finger/Zn-ribbon topoisomerase 1